MEEKMVPIYICTYCKTVQLSSEVAATISIDTRVKEWVNEEGVTVWMLTESVRDDLEYSASADESIIINESFRLCVNYCDGNDAVFEGRGACIVKTLIPLSIYNYLYANEFHSKFSMKSVPIDTIITNEKLPYEFKALLTTIIV